MIRFLGESNAGSNEITVLGFIKKRGEGYKGKSILPRTKKES